MGAGSSIQSSMDLPQLLCCARVEQSTVAMEETCGRYDSVLDPGCHFMPWCVGRRVAGYLSLRVQQLDVRCETKSKDNVFVTVVCNILEREEARTKNSFPSKFWVFSVPTEPSVGIHMLPAILYIFRR
ncbi:hypothetical protein C2845_PM07G13890 [Panicum miliaceum]|uniref:Uncharacterized protein n=1 Tax=Panicum miliaceum TaxID=4540 RepID=A0A3L6SQX1_PANMI|nr:hypothetical protein C2845_PM07G13890 [Panicum miliaceum]